MPKGGSLLPGPASPTSASVGLETMPPVARWRGEPRRGPRPLAAPTMPEATLPMPFTAFKIGLEYAGCPTDEARDDRLQIVDGGGERVLDAIPDADKETGNRAPRRIPRSGDLVQVVNDISEKRTHAGKENVNNGFPVLLDERDNVVPHLSDKGTDGRSSWR